jgi:adenylate cyclase
MLYNLACAFAVESKDLDASLDLFEQFFERIKSTTILRHMEVDPDVDPLRDNQRFQELVAETRERLGMDKPATA